MEKNYSDGLDYLIKRYITLPSEKELLLNVQKTLVAAYCYKETSLCEAFSYLTKKSNETGISYYYENESLIKEQNVLKDEAKNYMNYLMKNIEKINEYDFYLLSRNLLAFCIYCPYILSREEIYKFWRFCIVNKVF